MWLFRRHRHLSPELLSGYLDQRLSPAERSRVSRGLASCAACREELAGWRNTLALLQGLEDIPAPRSFTLAGPPLVPVAAPPPLPLRAPRWVYAGAASMAGLALAVMVSLEAAGLAPAAPPDTGSESASRAAAPAQAPQPAIANDSADAPPEPETMRAAEATAEADPPEGPEITRLMPPEDSDDAPPHTPAPFAMDKAPDPADTDPAEIEFTGPAGQPGPDEDAPTADPAPAVDHLALAPAEGAPLFWRVLQGVAATLLVVLLGALALKRRSSSSRPTAN